MIEGIEQDTLEDPPLLFREYVGAPPELKRIMDSQFKLLKSWARFKAKGGWYSWRDQLLGGVMPTLVKNAEGLRKVKRPLSCLMTGQSTSG
jgi:kinetochore protein Spc7/SPC105